jgi:outer membrane protein, multidrug efflux system
MNRIIRLLLIFVLVFLSGCSLAPKYQKPLLPVSAKYPGYAKSASGNGKSYAYDIPWQEYFKDPYLRKLILIALDNNRDLRITALRVKETKALYQIERSKLFPTINLDGTASRMHTPADISVTGAPLTISNYQVDFSFTSWELDFWGHILNLKKAAFERFLASDETRRAATLSLISQVAENYLILRALDERILLAEETVANHKKSFAIFTKRFKVGAISRLDLSQVETLLRDAEALSAELKQGRDAASHILTFLVGSGIPDRPTDTYFSDNLVLDKVRIGLPSELLTARPDIVAAEHVLKAQGANIGAARAAFFPKITLTSLFGTASSELERLFRNGNDVWNFTPDLTLPIFDAGYNRAFLKGAKVQRDIAVANYEKTIQIAFREVSDALSARFWLEKEVHIHKQLLAAQTERARLAKLRYDNGAAPYLEVLDAERDLLSAKQQLVQTRRAFLSSRVRLYAALGGGSKRLDYAYNNK